MVGEMIYYISHHGIQGQRWGVQNGPPYPLDYEDHNAREKRFMKKEAKEAYKKAVYAKGAATDSGGRVIRAKKDLDRYRMAAARNPHRSQLSKDNERFLADKYKSELKVHAALQKNAEKTAKDAHAKAMAFTEKYGERSIKDIYEYRGNGLAATVRKTAAGASIGALIAGPLGALAGGAIGENKDRKALESYRQEVLKKSNSSTTKQSPSNKAVSKELNKLASADFDGDKIRTTSKSSTTSRSSHSNPYNLPKNTINKIYKKADDYASKSGKSATDLYKTDATYRKLVNDASRAEEDEFYKRHLGN